MKEQEGGIREKINRLVKPKLYLHSGRNIFKLTFFISAHKFIKLIAF